jgi:hypothetical protein
LNGHVCISTSATTITHPWGDQIGCQCDGRFKQRLRYEEEGSLSQMAGASARQR